MFGMIGSMVGRAARTAFQKPAPDPNVSDGGYRPRSQRGRDAIASMRQSSNSFAQEASKAEAAKAAAAQAAAMARAKPAPAKASRFLGRLGGPSSEDNNNTYADGGIVSKDRSVGRSGSLYGKNMKK